MQTETSRHCKKIRWLKAIRTALLFISFCFVVLFTTGATAAAGKQSMEIVPNFVHIVGIGSTATLNAKFYGQFPDVPVASWSVNDPAALDIHPNGNEVTIMAKVPVATVTVTATYENLTATAKIIIGYALESDTISVLLTKVGQSSTIHVDVFELGLMGQVQWTVSDPDAIALYPNHTSARVVAKTAVGSATVTATYKDISIDFPVMVAKLKDNTKAISASAIKSVDVEFDGTNITGITAYLKRNQTTLNIHPGDILVNSSTVNGVFPLLARALNVQITPFQVIVYGELATLTDAYQEANVSVKVRALPGSTEALSRTLNSPCTINGTGVTLDVEMYSIDVPPPVDFYVDYTISNGLEYLSIGADVHLDVALHGPEIDLGYQVQVEIECEFPLTSIPLNVPGTPLVFFATPLLGLNISGIAEIIEIHMATGTATIHYDGYHEFTYQRGSEPTTYSDIRSVTATLTESPGVGDMSGDGFEIEVWPHVGLNFGVGIWLVMPEITFLKFKAGPTARLEIPYASRNSPLPPDSLYQNPGWDIDFHYEAELTVELDSMFNYYIIIVFDRDFPGIDLSITLGEGDARFGGTPDILLSTASPIVTSGTPTELEIYIDAPISLAFHYIYTDQPVDVWASKDGQNAFLIGSSTMNADGTATVNWTPTSTGVYEIAALVYDRITGWIGLPYLTNSRFVGVVGIDTFNATPVSGSAPLDVAFSWQLAAPPGTIINCTLDPGDGAPAISIYNCLENTAGSHAYTTPGTYNATLSVGNSTASVTVTVSEGGSVTINSFTVTPNSGAAPLDVTFSWQLDNPGGGAVTCILNPGDGSPTYTINNCDNNTSQMHQYAISGTYNATLSAGGDTASVTVSVNPGGDITIISFEATPDTGAAPLQVVFSWELDNPGGSVVDCTLDPGDGSGPIALTDCANTTLRLHTYTTSGAYLATLVAGTNTAFVIVTVDTAISSFVATPANGTAPLATTFSWQLANPGGEPITCTLDPGDGSPVYTISDCANNASQAHTYLTSGAYTALLTAGQSTATTVVRIAKWAFHGIDDDLIISSPALSPDGSVVYANTPNNGTLYAMNSSDGSLQWSFTPSTGLFGMSSPAVGADGTIYHPNANRLYALNPNGSLRWSFTAGGEVTSPAVSGSTVYVAANDCQLYALNTASGAVVWSLTLGAGQCEGFDPIVGADGVIYTWHDWDTPENFWQLFAVNPDGTLKWTRDAGENGANHTQPAMNMAGNLVYMQGSTLYGVYSETGGTIWEYTLPFQVDGCGYSRPDASPVIGNNGNIYVIDSSRNLHAIHDGEELWSTHIGTHIGTRCATPTLSANSTLYVTTADGYLYAINSINGSILWAFDFGVSVYGAPPLGNDGVVYVGADALYAIQTGSSGLNSGPWPKFRHDNSNTGQAQ